MRRIVRKLAQCFGTQLRRTGIVTDFQPGHGQMVDDVESLTLLHVNVCFVRALGPEGGIVVVGVGLEEQLAEVCGRTGQRWFPG